MEYLVETALITQGLQSISQQQLFECLEPIGAHLLWMDKGQVKCGTVEEYLPFRATQKAPLRINCNMLEQVVREQSSGAFTASGTMAVCEKEGIPLAVTCGMGGLDIRTTPDQCPDLFALSHIPVTLVATSPKDMMDIAATLQWLKMHQVTILGRKEPVCNGYLFSSAEVPLAGIYENQPIKEKLLLLNGIPLEKRLKDKKLLDQAIQNGYQAIAQGHYFHPAVNGFLDLQTLGYASQIQLESLLDNILWAQAL